MGYTVGMQTGYYGRVGPTGRTLTTKVHLRPRGQYGPLCGATIHPDMAFHWCANWAEMGYVDCEHCRKMVAGEKYLNK